jgi:uncharacterized protein
MAEAAAASPLGLRKAARRGLAVYLGLVVVLSALFEGLIISTGVMGVWLLPLMCTPAAASVVARLVLREGFSDVSFRFGGLRTLPWYALGLGVPLAVGTLAYGAAWLTGLLGFQGGAVAFLVGLASAATWMAVLGFLLTAGEEIGWRGYMLTRLIDAGVPRPVLASGLIWGLWHTPLILAGMYAAGSWPVVSTVLFMVQITSTGFVIARMRLETGSIWPAIAQHGAWNSIIQGPFDLATKSSGAGATLWVGEEGILVAITMVVAAVIFSRGHWTIRRVPEVQQGEVAASPAPHR